MQTRHRFTIQNVEPTDIEVLWFDFSSTGYITKMEDLKDEDVKKWVSCIIIVS